jgi:AraC-like DNA-binding protein
MLHEAFRVAAITTLLVLALHLLKAKAGKTVWLPLAFIVSIVLYLSVDWFETINRTLYSILIAGPILLPVFFWMLSKSIFDDHFRVKPLLFVMITLFLASHYGAHYLAKGTDVSDNIRNLIRLVPKVLSFLFMAFGVWEAIRNRKHDLIDARLRFRNTFIIVTATLIGITLIVEIIELSIATPEILPTIQKAAIFLLTLAFIYFNMELELGFFIRTEKVKPETAMDTNPQIVEKITRLLSDEKIYRTEGLTIGSLAERLKEQEYRVRRTINGQLGFRNFNDFLNQYRAQEACAILKDPQKANLTILEIAYSLGYQSIGPFNKAFKEQTGQTPTAFRKQSLQ